LIIYVAHPRGQRSPQPAAPPMALQLADKRRSSASSRQELTWDDGART
jgi:hypothetical protein